MGIEQAELFSSRRKRLLRKARASMTYNTIHEIGYKGTKVNRVLCIKESTVSQWEEREKKILKSYFSLNYKLII